MLALLVFIAVQDPMLRAESLLAAGDAYRAARAMERVVAERPKDVDAYLLLGRAHFARPVIGRYPALDAFRIAARLAPGNPAPLYWQSTVGLFLGSDEGERIAREALIAVLALDPDYRDAWRRFRTLFGNADIWRRADAALARHPHRPNALARRAYLALRLEEPERADALLTQAQYLGDRSVETLLLRAEASFLKGDLAAGEGWIGRAVAHAADDSSEALWQRFWLIASPAEQAAYLATPPSDRPRFFTAFLDRRDPNLVTVENERLAEHFARLAYARRQFRLLHPLNQYHRSARARSLSALRSRELLAELSVAAPILFLGAPTDRAAAAGGAGPDRRAVTETDTAATTAYFLAGLDARGLLWLRHGPPRQQVNGTLDALRPFVDGERALDMESWVYESPRGLVSVGFQRASGGVWGDVLGGDFLFQPVSLRQQRWTRALLRTDDTALPAALAVPVWIASFLSADGSGTEVYARTISGTSALALWDAQGQPRGRALGTGLLRLRASPGTYDVGLDVVTDGAQGRIRGALTIPAFSAATFAVSDLVLGATATVLDREQTLAAMPPDLTFTATGPLSAYAELYHLHADSLGRVRYRARYTFAHQRSLLGRLLGGAQPITLEFEREALAAVAVREQLVIEPARVPPGRYRITLQVTDLLANVKSQTAAIDITIR